MWMKHVTVYLISTDGSHHVAVSMITVPSSYASLCRELEDVFKLHKLSDITVMATDGEDCV